MAESSAPTISGSRSVADQEYEVLSSGFAADGVLGQWTNSTPVFGDSSGRQVKIRANFFALVGGHYYSSGTSDTIRSISANASGSTRIDLVVLGLNRSTLAVTSYIKNGTPGAGAPPALQRDARGLTTGIWEIPIAQVTVVNGAATIAVGDVTNIAWYSRGNVVGTLSTAPPQPDAASYPYLIHTDTGTMFESLSNAWRRWPWQVARGMIGGKRYTSGATLVASIGTSETLAGLDSGSVSLEANRRYRLHLHSRIAVSANDTYFTVRLRETNISGTVVGFWNQLVRGFGANHDYEFVQEITTSASATKTYVASFQTASNTLNSNAGSTTSPAGVWVEDVGPSLPNVVTVV